MGHSKISGEATRPADTRSHQTQAVTRDEVKATVFVVDDDISVRDSLADLLVTEGWQPITFSSAREFLDYQTFATPCCLILDLSLPDISGLDLQRLISAGGSELPIIFVSGYGDVPTTVKAMKAGAVEFLTKPYCDDVLIEAVRLALVNSQARSIIDNENKALQRSYSTLSPREREVMRLVVLGQLNKSVGFALGISEITVKAHRGQVMRKMNARSFADLVNMAARLCLGKASEKTNSNG